MRMNNNVVNFHVQKFQIYTDGYLLISYSGVHHAIVRPLTCK